MRLDDDVRYAPCRRVDDDVGELAECTVGALDGAAEVEAHRRPLSGHLVTVIGAGGARIPPNG